MVFKLFGDHEVFEEKQQCLCLVAKVSQVTPIVCFTL
jgi:hypothetical protein